MSGNIKAITLYLERLPDGQTQVKLNGDLLKVEKSLGVKKMAPQFDWGHDLGGGPQQLALAICLELWPEVAEDVYERFSRLFIATLKNGSCQVNIDITQYLPIVAESKRLKELYPDVVETDLPF